LYQSMEISIYGFIQDAVAARGWAVVACSDLTESQAQLVAKNREMRVDVVHLPAGRCYRFEPMDWGLMSN